MSTTLAAEIVARGYRQRSGKRGPVRRPGEGGPRQRAGPLPGGAGPGVGMRSRTCPSSSPRCGRSASSSKQPPEAARRPTRREPSRGWRAATTRGANDWGLGVEAVAGALLARTRGRRPLPRGDRAPGADAAAPRAGPRAPALRRVVAPREPPRRRARAAARRRTRCSPTIGMDAVRRAGPDRAARDGRESPQAHRRDTR